MARVRPGGGSAWAGLILAAGCYQGTAAFEDGGPSATQGPATSGASAPGDGGPGPSSSTPDPGTTAPTDPSGPGSSTGGTADTLEPTDGSGSTTGSDAVQGTLEIFWVDVEGGAATLLVPPSGEVVLVDTGNPGDRDATRIAAVVEDVIGADHIDVCVVTHYDGDHVGGVPDLAQRLPIDEFWDHGETVGVCGGGDCAALWNDYLDVAQGKRITITAGEVREFSGLELHFVAAHGDLVVAPLEGGGAANPACDGASSMPPSNDENTMSLGFVARFGAFDFLDLADLYWFQEHELVCPDNLLGAVDLYQTTHHGLTSSGATQLVHGVEPLVVIMNNGPTKGGSEQAYDGVVSAPSDPDLWQLHRAVNNDAQHNTAEERIANLAQGSGDQAHWVRATIDGPTATFTVHNSRNAHARTYDSQ